jgi:hypothetical protein
LIDMNWNGGQDSGASQCDSSRCSDTFPTDMMGSGIYNPAPIGIANSDDDGGFLRRQLLQYYAGSPTAVCP